MGRRPLPDDFIEFIGFLNANDVEYLLVGGWAVGIHGFPRATKDIDFLIAVTGRNLDRLRKAFAQFGAPTIDMALFREKGNFFRMGRSPVQIDVITDAAGIDFRECYARREIVDIDGTPVSMISIDDLIANKVAAGRPQDIADAKALEKWKRRRAAKKGRKKRAG